MRPPNSGQVLAEFAKTLGGNVNQFNPQQRLRGRDYIQSVRRARHKHYKRVSIPTQRPTKHLQCAIKKMTPNEQRPVNFFFELAHNTLDILNSGMTTATSH